MRNSIAEGSDARGVPELYVGGRWESAREGERREIRCPADGTLVAEVDEAGPQDTAAAIARGPRGLRRRAVARHRRRSSAARCCTGSPTCWSATRTTSPGPSRSTPASAWSRASTTSTTSSAVFRHYAELAAEEAGRVVDTGRPDVVSRVVHEPVGVCGADHALELPAAADRPGRSRRRSPPGNTFVLKPSELTPHTAILLMRPARGGRAARRRGQPRARRRPAGGRAAQRGPARRPGRRSPAGWRPASGSWPPPPPTVKKVALELGGKNPNVVFADADLRDRPRLRADRGLPALRPGLLGRRPAARRGVDPRRVRRRAGRARASGSGSAARSTTTPRPAR